MKNVVLSNKEKGNRIRLCRTAVLLVLFFLSSVQGWSQLSATISGEATVCIGDPAPVVTFTGSGGVEPYTFTYSLNGIVSTIESVGAEATYLVSTGSAGTYEFILTSVKDQNGEAPATGIVTVKVNPNASVASVTGSSPLCIGNEATYSANGLVYGGSGTGGWSSSNPGVASVDPATGAVIAISEGTTDITYTITGGCGGTASAYQQLTVNPDASIALTSGPGTNNQSLCINTTLAGITYSIGGGGTGAGVTGLPTGVSGVYSEGVFTISGTPSAAGTFNYTVTTTGTCVQKTATGILTVNPDAAISLTSPAGTVNQSLCINTPLTGIAYSISGGGTGASVSGLPTGVTGVYNSGTFTISGTPSVPGTFNYTVSTTGTCSQTSATGTITVNPDASITLTSDPGTNNQSLCINTTLTDITYSIGGGGTGAGVTGLPTGVSGVYSGGVFTISGTPSAAGLFNYTVTTTGTCVQTSTTGTITVNPDASITLTSFPGTNNQSLCINTPITSITYSIGGGGTGASVSGLPTGVTGLYSSGTFTISGTPSVPGTFNYTVSTTGTCSQTSATGTITVNPDASISLTSDPGTNNQTLCINTLITEISYFIGGGGTGAGVTGLPTGVSGVYSGGVFTISGTPSAAGAFNFTVTTTGTCVQKTATGTFTVNPDATIALASGVNSNIQSLCANTAIKNIVYLVAGGGTGADVTGLPEGVNGVFSGGIFTISGIPTASGTFNYVVTTTGTCAQTTATGIITVNSIPTATISGTTEVCKGAPSPEIVFTGESGVSPYTFTYTVNGGSTRTISTPAGSNTTTLIVPTSAATTYTYTLVSVKDASSTSCSQAQSGSAVVTINPLPIATVAGTTIVCEGAALPVITFTGASGTAPYTFVYTVNSGNQQSVTTENGNTSVTVTVPTGIAGGYTYSLVSVTDASSTACSQPVAGSATVTVNQLPAPPTPGTITPPTCILSTGSVRLTGLPSSGTWTLTRYPDLVVTPGSGTIVTISGIAAGTYTYTVTNSGGCTSAPSEEIVIPDQPPTPVVVVSNPAAVCSPVTVNIALPSVTAGSTPDLIYSYWTNPAATIAYTTPTAATAGTYYIKGTNSFGCYDIKPVVVTVNQTPSANAGSGGNECDLSFTFNGTSSIGIGTWTLSSGPGTVSFSPNANAPTATVTVSTYGTYTFTWTEVNGECSKSSTISVNFYEQPVASAGAGGNNCGLEFYLDATKNVGVGTWTMSSGPGTASFSPDANTPNALVTVSSYGTYSFRWTVTNGTCSAISTVTVKFIEQPAANAGSGGEECDLSFMLNAVQGSGTTGTWKLISGPGTAGFTPSVNTPSATVNVTAFGTYSFSWTEVNSVCKSSDIINVVFHDIPPLSAGEDINICNGSTVQLQAQGTGTFSWAPDTLVDNPEIFNPVASPVETTLFTVTLTDQYGCVNSDDVKVTLWDTPVAYAGRDTTLDYLFYASLEAQLGAYETGRWSVEQGSASFTDINSPTTDVTGLSLHRNVLVWTITNGVCPEVSDNVIVTVNDLTVPTLITPNGDNKNEFLFFKGKESLGKTELIVFDRRGTMVYQTKDYNNDWNGVDNAGKELPDDTYFIILKAENGKSLSSFIVIRR